MNKFNCALISVSNKDGVAEFAKQLSEFCSEIISTGGTSKLLASSGVKVTEIDKYTGFPEILDGRVKTLNPKIHGGILAIRSSKSHTEEIKKHGIKPIDIVVVNLYPFEANLLKTKSAVESRIPQDIIENIDIGGVTLLRAAAKNFEDVMIVCDPEDYMKIIEAIKTDRVNYEFKKELAAKAFRHTAYYDSIISSYFTVSNNDIFPEKISIGLRKMSPLRYGENSHQQASLYGRIDFNFNEPKLTESVKLQGKELSYNNYLDLDSAVAIVREFDKPACVIVKHNNPCGVAEGSNLQDAYERAFACDPASAFGGIMAFNRDVDEETAAEISKLFVECIIAPGFTAKAKELFSKKKDLRLLQMPIKKAAEIPLIDYRTVSGGMLVQDKDVVLGLNALKSATNKETTAEEMESLKFAWKVCKHVKSNAIILVRGTQTVGIGAGQMSRIDSVKIANSKMNLIKDLSADAVEKPLVLASDAFFPFRDVVDESAKIGVKAIIQPGGSLKDQLSIDSCNENDIAMVFTGMRHFKH